MSRSKLCPNFWLVLYRYIYIYFIQLDKQSKQPTWPLGGVRMVLKHIFARFVSHSNYKTKIQIQNVGEACPQRPQWKLRPCCVAMLPMLMEVMVHLCCLICVCVRACVCLTSLTSPVIGCVLQIHERLRQYERQSPTPVLHSAASLAEDVSSTTHTDTHTHTNKEHTQCQSVKHLSNRVSPSVFAETEER
jgi:hypothetical protein